MVRQAQARGDPGILGSSLESVLLWEPRFAPARVGHPAFVTARPDRADGMPGPLGDLGIGQLSEQRILLSREAAVARIRLGNAQLDAPPSHRDPRALEPARGFLVRDLPEQGVFRRQPVA